MLGRQKTQLSFTDIDVLQAWEKKPIVQENSIYYGLSQVSDIFKDELFAEAYSFSGRPSIPPSLLIKVLLLQFYDKVSDREAENRARYDLRWKVALGLSIGESGKERKAFEEILGAAIAKGLLPGDCARQIVDSTYMLGAGAVQDTYTLIRTAIRKLLKVVSQRIDIRVLLSKCIFR